MQFDQGSTAKQFRNLIHKIVFQIACSNPVVLKLESVDPRGSMSKLYKKARGLQKILWF